MRNQMFHRETHRTERIGWLRAAILGANDGIVSTGSLVVGVAAAHATSKDTLIAGVGGLVAGAMWMAAGEYVSVSSQADTERADIELERRELATDPSGELLELTRIYEERGLDPALAKQVAEQLTVKNALVTHARDELGIIDALRRTRLDGLSTRIKLDFDADGKVIDAALLESTGNENLDAAILKWARGVKLKPGSPAGAGVLPMTLMRPR